MMDSLAAMAAWGRTFSLLLRLLSSISQTAKMAEAILRQLSSNPTKSYSVFCLFKYPILVRLLYTTLQTPI